jgi:hypothetical protein
MAASSALSTPHVDAHPVESFLTTILSVPSLLVTAIDTSRFPTDAQLSSSGHLITAGAEEAMTNRQASKNHD